MRKIAIILLASLMISFINFSTVNAEESSTTYKYWSENDYDAMCSYYGIEWKRNLDTGKYEYPITPDSEAWKELDHIGKILICRIPEAVVADITDTELMELVVKYPLLVDIYVHDSFGQGLEYVSTYFPNLKYVIEHGIAESYIHELSTHEIEKSNYDELELMFLDNLKDYLENEIDLLESRASSTYVYTPNGTAVPCSIRGELLSTADKTKIKNEIKAAYPNTIFLGEATTNYNCHSYAWYSQSTSNKVWMNSPAEYLTDGSYTYIGSRPTAAGQRIFFANSNHSAIVVSLNSNFLNVVLRSKWGEKCLMQHTVNDNPYYTSSTQNSDVRVYTR